MAGIPAPRQVPTDLHPAPPDPSVLGNSDPLASGPARVMDQSISGACRRDESWSGHLCGQQPALCFGPRHQTGLHLTLHLPLRPQPEHIWAQPPKEEPVLAPEQEPEAPGPSCHCVPNPQCISSWANFLAGPPMMGTWVPSPWAEPPDSTMQDPWPVLPPRPECLDAPYPHSTWFTHTGLWAIQGMPFVDMQNFYEYSFL